tara:strand:+ start:78 stop:635 length:558 start_codon:yes stop_codon:yes gene_type:complete
MIRIIIIIFFILFQHSSYASIKTKIINNFKSIESLKFNFIQKIDEKIEKGECIIVYPKKIFCQYDDFYNKILVSNGKSLIINSDKQPQYYRYPLNKTPLNIILDKNYLIKKMEELNNQSDTSGDYSFKFNNNKTSIIIHFDRSTLNLIGWSTKDVYQNKVETKILNLKTNLYFNKNIFNIVNYIN